MTATSSRLVTQESNPEFSGPKHQATQSPMLCSDVAFRHSGWVNRRTEVLSALRSLHPKLERVLRFDACGSNAWVLRCTSDPDVYKIAADYCHDRWCQPCAGSRGRAIARNIVAHLGKRPYKFLTLTIKTDNLDLAESVAKLYDSFRRLRTTVMWKRAVSGGAAFCEIKWRPGAERWHPHLHLIIESKYMPKRQLVKHWLRITKDSFIVDIQAGKSADHAARYVAGYCTKALDRSIFGNQARLAESMNALSGRRLCLTFGDWRGLRLTDTTDESTWDAVARLTTIQERALEGNEESIRILNSLERIAEWDQMSLPKPPTRSRDGP